MVVDGDSEDGGGMGSKKGGGLRTFNPWRSRGHTSIGKGQIA